MRYASSAKPKISSWLLAASPFASPTFLQIDGATTATSVAMIANTTSSSSSVNPDSRRATLGGSDTQHLVHGRVALRGLAPTIVGKWSPPGFARERFEFTPRRTASDGVADGFVDHREFEHSQSPLVPRALARAAATAAHDAANPNVRRQIAVPFAV